MRDRATIKITHMQMQTVTTDMCSDTENHTDTFKKHQVENWNLLFNWICTVLFFIQACFFFFPFFHSSRPITDMSKRECELACRTRSGRLQQGAVSDETATVIHNILKEYSTQVSDADALSGWQLPSVWFHRFQNVFNFSAQSTSPPLISMFTMYLMIQRYLGGVLSFELWGCTHWGVKTT